MLSPHEIAMRSHVKTFSAIEGVREGLGNRRPRSPTGPISSAGT